MQQIKTIVMHFSPHLEDWFTYWMVWRFGEKKQAYDGIRQARIMLVDAGEKTPDGRSAQEWENEGCLVIDIWGSWCDGHTLPLEQQSNGACAATIMAHRLGIRDDRALARLINFVSRNDCQGHSMPFDIASITKDLNASFAFQGRMAAKHEKQFPLEVQAVRVRDIMFAIFDAEYHQAINFAHALDDAKENHGVEKVSVDCADGRERLVVVARSSNEQMNRALRSLDPRPDIIIQRRGNGQVTIFASGSMSLETVRERIIGAECKRGRTRDEAEDLWCWFNRNTANTLMNGGLSAPKRPPTRIDLAYILRIVCQELRHYVAPKKA